MSSQNVCTALIKQFNSILVLSTEYSTAVKLWSIQVNINIEHKLFNILCQQKKVNSTLGKIINNILLSYFFSHYIKRALKFGNLLQTDINTRQMDHNLINIPDMFKYINHLNRLYNELLMSYIVFQVFPDCHKSRHLIIQIILRCFLQLGTKIQPQ